MTIVSPRIINYNVRLRRNDNFTREITIPLFFLYSLFAVHAPDIREAGFRQRQSKGNGSQNHLNRNIASSTIHTYQKTKGNKKTLPRQSAIKFQLRNRLQEYTFYIPFIFLFSSSKNKAIPPLPAALLQLPQDGLQ